MPKRRSSQNGRRAWTLVQVIKIVASLANTVESQAWGGIAWLLTYAVSGYGAHQVASAALRVEFATVAYGVTVALYAIFWRSAFAVRRRLTSAKVLYVNEVITRAEYIKMREKILQESGRL